MSHQQPVSPNKLISKSVKHCGSSPELCTVSSCSVEGGGSLVFAGLWESITWGMNFFGQPGGCGWSFRYPNCKTEGWAGQGVLSQDLHEDWQMCNEGWLLDRLGMLSCVVYFTCCIKKSICHRNPRGISSLIVGNPPSSARWRRITQILGLVPTIVQVSTVNICESLLFGSVDFWANAGFFSFRNSQRYLCLRTIFLFCNQSLRSWEFIHEGLARSVIALRDVFTTIDPGSTNSLQRNLWVTDWLRVQHLWCAAFWVVHSKLQPYSLLLEQVPLREDVQWDTLLFW